MATILIIEFEVQMDCVSLQAFNCVSYCCNVVMLSHSRRHSAETKIHVDNVYKPDASRCITNQCAVGVAHVQHVHGTALLCARLISSIT
jgi:hypothetical protein